MRALGAPASRRPLDPEAGRRGALPGTRVAVVALVAAAALAAQLVPALASLLEYDRVALARGELWRLLTGHLAHASWDHLGLDFAVFVALALIAPAGAVLRTMLLSGFAIPAAVWLFLPHLAVYRGLSGIDAALVSLLASEAIRDRLEGRATTGLAVAAGATLVGLAAKTVWEVLTGAAFFVDLGAGFVPVPLAHAVGGLTGVLVAVLRR